MCNKMTTGLTSVTFRALDWREVIAIVKDCGLGGIEWGGDIHVPPGDEVHARRVSRATAEAGLAVLSYGSYYRLGAGECFVSVLETALALGAGVIRVWAGVKGSAEHSEAERKLVIEDARRIADMAKEYNIVVALEYHRNTLTDTSESAVSLLKEAGGVKTYWQPNPELGHEDNLKELAEVLPWLVYLHVFQWKPDGARLPLQDGVVQWREYIEQARGCASAAILEFVRNDTPTQCANDAETLRRICE